MTPEKKINIIASLFLIWGMVSALGLSFLAVIAVNVSQKPAITLPFVLIFALFAAYSVLMFVTAFYLYKRRAWARKLAIALSVLNLFSFPVGTAIGVMTLMFLRNKEVAAEFITIPLPGKIQSG